MLRLGDFRANLVVDESLRGTSAFDECQPLNEPVVPASSFSRMVNRNFLSNVKLHDIEMPWELGVAKLVFGDDLLPSESLAAQPLWPTSSLVVEAKSHDEVTLLLRWLVQLIIHPVSSVLYLTLQM